MVSEAVGSNLKAKKGGRECRTIDRGLMRRCGNDQRNYILESWCCAAAVVYKLPKKLGVFPRHPRFDALPHTKKRQTIITLTVLLGRRDGDKMIWMVGSSR